MLKLKYNCPQNNSFLIYITAQLFIEHKIMIMKLFWFIGFLGTYFIFSGVSFGTIVFIHTLVPETKGRTLEEIQSSLVRLS